MSKRKVSIALKDFQRLYGDMRALEMAAQLGADAADFNLDLYQQGRGGPQALYNRSDEEITDYFEKLYRHACALGLEIFQTHGRMRIYYGDPEKDQQAIASARLDCLATKALHARYCVMHSVACSVMPPNPEPQRMRDLCFSVFRQILTFAKAYDVTVATETFGYCASRDCCDFFGNAQEFFNIYQRICREGEADGHFAICVDTGHSNHAARFGNPPPQEMIRRAGERLACLHLHDNDGQTDQHKLPKTGTIDWEAIFDALDAVGYSGTYNMELRLGQFGRGFEVETAAFAIKLMRHMLRERYGQES